MPPPDPLYWCCVAGSYTGRGGASIAIHWIANWTTFPCRHWPHHPSETQCLTARRKCAVPNRTPRGSLHKLNELSDPMLMRTEGLAGERVPVSRAPSLAFLPPRAFVSAVPANLAPHKAAKDPLKGHMRVGRARQQGLIPCAALLEGLWRPRHQCGPAGGRGSGPQGI